MTNSLKSIKNSTQVLMYHRHYEVDEARLHFEKYLTDYELQEEQIEGRFWVIKAYKSYLALYILIDNKTFIMIESYSDGTVREIICDSQIIKGFLPEEFRGCYYD